MSKEFTDQLDQDQKDDEAGTGQNDQSGDQPFLEIDGRVFKSKEDVIKNIVNAQSHIQKLEAEAAQRNQDANGGNAADQNQDLARQILDALKQQDRKDDQTDQSSKVNADDIVKNVLQKLDSDKAETEAQARNDKCHSLAEEVLGEDYMKVISKEAKRLNMSLDKVNQLARTSVEAFSELFLSNKGGDSNRSFSSDSDSNSRAIEKLLSGGNNSGEKRLASFKGKSDKERVSMVTDLAAEYGIEYGKGAR